MRALPARRGGRGNPPRARQPRAPKSAAAAAIGLSIEQRAVAARSLRWNGRPCGASSTPPAWCCTPISAARRWRPVRLSSPATRNLEYDLAAGRRGKRDVHIGGLLERLLGAPGIAVNNNAAALFLALNELAAGGEAIVSRGELIEIGDGFRIPEIMQRSGAVLREVGTTNRTHIDDYRAAITERTRLLLRVHPSNFRITGFTARPAVANLRRSAASAALPVYEDLGSGCLADLRAFGIDEPLVSDSLRPASIWSPSAAISCSAARRPASSRGRAIGRTPPPRPAVSRAASGRSSFIRRWRRHCGISSREEVRLRARAAHYSHLRRADPSARGSPGQPHRSAVRDRSRANP